MKIGISPCPNDTFLFHAWISGKIESSIVPEVTFGDIQQLNQWAMNKRLPFLKVSFFCFGKILDEYDLLPIGAALGHCCGPKLISKKPFALHEIKSKKVAIPGKETTAHLLFEHFCPPPLEKKFCLYHEIFSLLSNDEVDCGVIIHESRFTFQQLGFYQIADFGELWEKRHGLPLPLGGLVVQKNVSSEALIAALKGSLNFARANPQESLPFILQHSQGKDLKVIQEHISLYVNRETEALSEKGIAAIDTLLSTGVKLSYFNQKNFTLR